MKRIPILTLLLLAASSIAFAQIDFSVNYTYTRPQQEMRTFIKQAHGMQMQGLVLVPNTPFSLGADLGYNTYGTETTRQTYRFKDGSSTETDVRVDNNFVNLNIVGRIDILSSGALIPYIMGKAGYNVYWTNLNIADPEDTDGCKPLENKSLLTDGAFSLSGGGGLRLDMSSIIKNAPKKRFYADLSAHYTQGGRVSYMNVNIPPDPDPVAHQHHLRTPSGDVVPYTARFVNPQNRIVHAHHVGDVYNSFIQSMEFKLGLMYRIVR